MKRSTGKPNRHKNLSKYLIRANSEHIAMMDSIADLRGTTRTQLIRESIFRFLILELRHESNQQEGMRNAKANLSTLTQGW